MLLNKKLIAIVSFIIFMVPATLNAMGNKPDENIKESAPTVTSTQPVKEPEVGKIDFQNLSNLVVDVETIPVLKEKLAIYKQITQELTTQVSLARQEASLYKQKFEEANAQIGINEQLYLKKEEALKADLEEAQKPRYKAMLASAGVGSLTTLILILALSL